jgi:hypothetical protein
VADDLGVGMSTLNRFDIGTIVGSHDVAEISFIELNKNHLGNKLYRNLGKAGNFEHWPPFACKMAALSSELLIIWFSQYAGPRERNG